MYILDVDRPLKSDDTVGSYEATGVCMMSNKTAFIDGTRARLVVYGIDK